MKLRSSSQAICLQGHPLINYYAVRNLTLEELKYLPKFTVGCERLFHFERKYLTGKRVWFFEGQASDTGKWTENVNCDLKYKAPYFFTVLNSTYKKVQTRHMLCRFYLQNSAFTSQIFNIISRFRNWNALSRIFSIAAGSRLGILPFGIHKIKFYLALTCN